MDGWRAGDPEVRFCSPLEWKPKGYPVFGIRGGLGFGRAGGYHRKWWL